MSFVFPKPVRPGDVIAIVAPSSPFALHEFWPGLAWLRGRYELRIFPSIFARDGYLAGDDARRTRELSRAMEDPDVRAIVAARGGYGVTRIANDLPWAAFARAPKWVVGFSDITALHAECWSRGIASIHASHVTGLGKRVSPRERADWLCALERPEALRAWRGLRVLARGRASGPIVGGNLAMLEATAAAGRLVIPEGAIVAIEDVTERPYRIDRMLTSLLVSGHLKRAAGIVFGGFTQCDAGPDGRRVDDVIEERTRALGVPVLSGAPFGHGDENEPIVFGARAMLEAGDDGALVAAP